MAEKTLPKALLFDVFGTLADWRSGIAREAERILGTHNKIDWIAFADAWRGEYQPGMEEIRSGRQSFAKLDVLHRRNLDRILPRFKLADLSDATLSELNLAWHKLPAWPDVTVALARLRKKFLLAPCSNGNIALMADLARHNDWHWDAILGSEVAGDFKPKPRVYLASCEAFNLAPRDCMMVAAHSYDLLSAAGCGMKTAHTARPNEYGPNTGEAGPKEKVDYTAANLADLADQLGC
jgi:2-haloacid dehalogenase